MGRLLMIACSQTKTAAAGKVRAIDRYDGPTFRVLRKYLRERAVRAPVVLILSGKYGLITADQRIPDYDCRLSAKAARRIRPTVVETARRALQAQPWESVGLCVGKEYRAALDGFLQFVPQGACVEVLGGGQGSRLTRLRDWLYRDQPVESIESA